MLLLVLSQVFSTTPAAYPILLCATGALGFGFGCTVPALNTFAARLDPARQDRSVLTLNALLGTGTALAPLLIAVFLALGAWWLLPVLAAVALAGFIVAAVRTPLSLSLAGQEFPRLGATSSGELIAGYQVGYGITAFGFAPLERITGIGLSGIYLVGAGVAVALAVVARAVTTRRVHHPRPPPRAVHVTPGGQPDYTIHNPLNPALSETHNHRQIRSIT